MIALGIFIAFVLLDFAWTKFTLSTAAHQPLPAAFWSVAITLLAGLSAVEYVREPLLLIPAAAGSAVGTYWGITFKH